MFLCIPLAHGFSAGNRSALIIRLDSGVAKPLLSWEDMCNATCVSIHPGSFREKLLGNLKHFGVPAELFLQQAQLRRAKAKRETTGDSPAGGSRLLSSLSTVVAC